MLIACSQSFLLVDALELAVEPVPMYVVVLLPYVVIFFGRFIVVASSLWRADQTRAGQGKAGTSSERASLFTSLHNSREPRQPAKKETQRDEKPVCCLTPIVLKQTPLVHRSSLTLPVRLSRLYGCRPAWLSPAQPSPQLSESAM